MRIYSFLVAVLLAGPAFAGEPQVITLNVQNMTCPACPITVKKALEQVPGVSDVKVDFGHKTAAVRLDMDRATIASLTKATADAGFPSTQGK
ncbi:cation transporter [Duganella fentianensis]|uniref:cation transporter n=1 Tax=Duganella fentianensis TaxID=2692177 RepID=UPI00192779EE|nr:cation transporter [Duganella fentianensis]